MRIPINKNIDQYRKDVVKGLSGRQAITILLLFVINVAGILLSIFVLHLPIIVSVFMPFPLSIIIGIVGFYRGDGMNTTLREALKRSWDVKFSETLHYESTEFDISKDVRYIESRKRLAEKQNKKSRKKKSKKKENVNE